MTSNRASSEQASLGWYSGRWILRDLGSSNGTTVDGKALVPRERAVLGAGRRLRFGDDEVWTLVDTSPPEPCAVLLGPQEYHWGQESLLVLPSIDAPDASLFVADGRWRLDGDEPMTSLESGDIVRLPSGYWRLLLPEDPGNPDALTASHALDLAHAELSFHVSAERLVLWIEQGSARVQLPSRACLYTLLVLARIRMRGVGPESEAGWVSTGDLAEMRGSSQEKVNVDVHRLRKLFQEAGVHHAAGIVERDDAKRLRIGVRRVTETAI